MVLKNQALYAKMTHIYSLIAETYSYSIASNKKLFQFWLSLLIKISLRGDDLAAAIVIVVVNIVTTCQESFRKVMFSVVSDHQ